MQCVRAMDNGWIWEWHGCQPHVQFGVNERIMQGDTPSCSSSNCPRYANCIPASGWLFRACNHCIQHEHATELKTGWHHNWFHAVDPGGKTRCRVWTPANHIQWIFSTATHMQQEKQLEHNGEAQHTGTWASTRGGQEADRKACDMEAGRRQGGMQWAGRMQAGNREAGEMKTGRHADRKAVKHTDRLQEADTVMPIVVSWNISHVCPRDPPPHPGTPARIGKWRRTPVAVIAHSCPTAWRLHADGPL
mgnify:CR=1 FL=1